MAEDTEDNGMLDQKSWLDEIPDDIKEVMDDRFKKREGMFDNLASMDRDQRKAMSRQLLNASRYPDNPFARRFGKPKHLLAKVHAYFDESKEMGRPYTWTGLANFLGCTRKVLHQYRKGEIGDNQQDKEYFKQILEMADQVIETSKQEMGLLGKYNASFALADLKYNHGWKDVQTVDTISSDGSARITKRVVDPVNPENDSEESYDRDDD